MRPEKCERLVRTRQGFSPALTEAVLDTVSAWDGFNAAATTLSVLPMPARSLTDFDQAAIVPPKVAKCFERESETLRNACFWAFPCYSGEFKSGQDEGELDATIRRAGEVHVVEWDRDPAPHVKVQLLNPWPGGMLAKRKAPFQLEFRILSKYLWELPIETVRVRLQDILGRELIVVHQAKGLVFSGEILTESQKTAKPAAANRRLMSFLRGGNF